MASNLKIPEKLRRKIDNEIQPGEFIRWVEQPIPRFFTGNSIAIVLFGIPWTFFVILWTWDVSGLQLRNLREGLQPQHLFALVGLPFILVGVGMLSSPIWVWYAARKTVYLVTDKRAICMQGLLSTTVRSYLPDQLRDIYRRERGDGTGDVIFGIRQWRDNDGDLTSEEVGFLGIHNPQEVEYMLRQLAKKNER